MDINNKVQIKKYFDNNQGTLLFPVLAEMYLNENKLTESRQVCEIGLEHHPNNVEGNFIFAELNRLEGDLKTTEKLLKRILAVETFHYSATINLANIQTKLKRAASSIAKSWKTVFKIDPANADAKAFLEKELARKPKKKIESKVKMVSENNFEEISPFPTRIKPQDIGEEELRILAISPRMATFTMVDVLKNQKLYQQAEAVLKMLEEKGADANRVEQERLSLQELINKSE